MKTKFTIAIVALISFFYFLPEPNKSTNAPVEKPRQSLNTNFIIRNVQFYDGDQLFNKVDVLIDDNRVEKFADSLPKQNKIPELEGSGKTLLPGLVDAHTHAYGNALSDALNFGVTTELDMFTMPAFANPEQTLRDNQENITKADLFSSTILATTKGGHGTEYGLEIPVITNVDQVENFVVERIAQGADYIKAVYNSKNAKRQFFPSISKEVLAELVKHTHHHGKMIVVHVDNLVSAKDAIKLGADGIVHSFMDTIVDADFVELMRKSNSFMVATLSIEAAIAGQSKATFLLENTLNQSFLSREQKIQLKAKFPNFGVPASAFENAKESVALLNQAGVTILAGTDAPNPSTTHGLSLHGEMQFLVESGLTPEQAIHSATGAATAFFPIGQRGTLKQGALASMILIDGNPFQEISLTQKISHIWKNGILIKRVRNTQQATTQISKGLISNFNEDIKTTEIGLGVFETSDMLAGGKSVVNLVLKPRLDLNEKYLHVSGELKKGFMFLWGGLSFIPGKSQQQGIDFNQVNGISFDAKGGAKTTSISVLLFQQGSFQPSAKAIQISKNWEHYEVAFSDFKNVDFSAITNISIVANEGIGEFEFMLDNLILD